MHMLFFKEGSHFLSFTQIISTKGEKESHPFLLILM